MGIYKKSQERFETILQLYKEGKTMTDLEQLTQTHRNTIRRQLIASGIDVDKESEKKYKEKLEQVVKLYEEGKYMDIFPTSQMTRVEQLNAITRFAIYMIILIINH